MIQRCVTALRPRAFPSRSKTSFLIARKLDEFGVDYIEGGYPLSNPKEEEFFKEMVGVKLKNAKLSAFGMTRRKNSDVADDTCIRALLASKTPVVTIVGKGDEYQVKAVLGTTLTENIRMIADSVSYCRKKGREVVFDPEHFFDGYKRNPESAMAVLTAAAEAGASTIALCDTNGGTLPNEVGEITEAVVKELGSQVIVGFHGHNDTNCAVANSLAAVCAGARHVQGTINGIGERCGNADMTSIIPGTDAQTRFHNIATPQPY